MKPKLLILTLLFVALGMKSQPAFDLTSHWTTITTNAFYNTTKIISYDIVGDTLIKNVKYSKIYRDNNYFCALRETQDNKIYCNFHPTIDYYREVLTYDFDWIEGKDLKFQRLFGDDVYTFYALSISIDSVKLLDNKYHKCIKNDDQIRCIRGIGDLHDFFQIVYGALTNGDQTSLLCFFKGDQLIYSNPNYNYCAVNAIGNDIKVENHVRIYKETDGSTILQLLDNVALDTVRIDIHNEMGMLVRTLSVDGTNRFKIDKLASGIYIYKTRSKNGLNICGKFIVNK